MDPVDFSALFTWSQACCIQLYVPGLTAKKLPNKGRVPRLSGNDI